MLFRKKPAVSGDQQPTPKKDLRKFEPLFDKKALAVILPVFAVLALSLASGHSMSRRKEAVERRKLEHTMELVSASCAKNPSSCSAQYESVFNAKPSEALLSSLKRGAAKETLMAIRDIDVSHDAEEVAISSVAAIALFALMFSSFRSTWFNKKP